MQRSFFMLSCLVAIGMAPLSVSAQSSKQPERSKELKDAEKFYTTAVLTQDTTERKSRLERALNPLQAAMVKDGSNPRVWLMAGQVYSLLHDFPRADSAFDKAEQLAPAMADEVAAERIHAWADLFNAGVTAMDALKFDEAIALLEAAEAMYPARPESKINLGALYANKGDTEKAEGAFRGAVRITEGPERAKLKPEDAANWKRIAEIGKVNVANMIGQRGVVAFDARQYDDAINAFRQARAVNPVARDYAYNLAQSIYARTAVLETTHKKLAEEEKAARAKKDVKTADAKVAEAKVVADQISAAYAEIEPLVTAARISDPNNEDLFLLLMRSYQIRSLVVGDPTTKTAFQKRSDELLRLHDTMQVELTTISVAGSSPDVMIRGSVRNIKLALGAPFKIRMTLLGIDGSVVGEQLIPLNAPAVDASAKFEVPAKVTAEVAGWKYVVE